MEWILRGIAVFMEEVLDMSDGIWDCPGGDPKRYHLIHGYDTPYEQALATSRINSKSVST